MKLDLRYRNLNKLRYRGLGGLSLPRICLPPGGDREAKHVFADRQRGDNPYGSNPEGVILEKVRPIVRMALKEDIGRGDVTTLLTVPKGRKAKGVIRAKEKGIVAGLPVAELIFKQVAVRLSSRGDSMSPRESLRVAFRAKVKEGEKVKKGEIIAEVSGDARSILTGERTALNFLQRLSGIATLTHRFAQKVRPYRVKIFDTRKTTPGLRYLEKYAVRCGGGCNHRMGLWDMVLIKDNHLKIQNSKFKVQNLKDMVEKIRERIPREMEIEVEAKNLREVKEALKAKADIIMLDNMNPKNMRKAVRLIRVKGQGLRVKVPLIEASGGITLENVREIAKTGVNRISIGALTHSAKALDISLDIATAKTPNAKSLNKPTKTQNLASLFF